MFKHFKLNLAVHVFREWMEKYFTEPFSLKQWQKKKNNLVFVWPLLHIYTAMLTAAPFGRMCKNRGNLFKLKWRSQNWRDARNVRQSSEEELFFRNIQNIFGWFQFNTMETLKLNLSDGLFYSFISFQHLLPWQSFTYFFRVTVNLFIAFFPQFELMHIRKQQPLLFVAMLKC